MRNLGLCHTTLDGVFHQLFVALAARPALIGLRDRIAVFVIGIRIDARESSHRAGGRPGAGRQSISHTNALAALDQGHDFLAGYHEWMKRFQFILAV